MATKHFPKNRHLHTLCSVLLLAIIICGMIGCKRDPIIGHMTYTNSIYIDSAATCFGVDSFIIKTPWIHNRLNNFLKDSATMKNQFERRFTITVYGDSLGDNHIEIIGDNTEYDGWIYFNSDGTPIEVDYFDYPNNYDPYHATYGKNIVIVIIGFMPYI